MRAGSRIVVLHDPLEWGVGAVVSVLKNGRLLCEFDSDGTVVREQFDPQDLEEFDVWMGREDSFRDSDFHELIRRDPAS